jgi:ferric-dicitrate binding protein FerR (iron transport regulator)
MFSLQTRDVDDEKQQLLQMMREQHQKHEHALSQQQQLYALLQDRNQTYVFV